MQSVGSGDPVGLGDIEYLIGFDGAGRIFSLIL